MFRIGGTSFVVLLISLLAVAIKGRSLLQEEGPEAEDFELPEDFEFPEFNCDFQGQFPYVVSVRTADDEHLCGGILIAKNAVLTAAHCVDTRATRGALVAPDLNIGGIDRNAPVEKRKTARAFQHPNWNGTTIDGNDIVILKLDNRTCATPVVTLGAKEAEGRANLTFLGYGRTSERGNFPNILQGSLMNTLTRRTCRNRYDFEPDVRRNELCVRGQSTVGFCTGDDGGPIILQPSLRVFQDVVVGIASYTHAGCTETEGASIFMNVRRYRKWIKRTLRSREFRQA